MPTSSKIPIIDYITYKAGTKDRARRTAGLARKQTYGMAGREVGGVLRNAAGAAASNIRGSRPDLMSSLMAQFGAGGGAETRTTSRSSGPFQWAGPNDGDFDAYAQRVIAGLNPAYDNAINAAGEQRGRATGEIGTSHAEALASFQRANTDYQRQAQALDAQVGQLTDSAKLQALGDASTVARDLAAQGQGMGQAAGSGDTGAGLAAIANYAAVDAGNVLDTQAALQRSLGARISEVQAQQQQDTRNSADQVKHAAEGTLANNYSDILNRIQADRAKATAAVMQEAERMKMDNRLAYANALAQHNSGNGTTTETVYGSSDPLERMAQLQQVAMTQKELQGGAGFRANPEALPMIAQGYLSEAENDPNTALQYMYSDVMSGNMTPEDFLRAQQFLMGG